MKHYYETSLNERFKEGYDQFVSTVINNKPNVSMPKDPQEALAWSEGMLQAVLNMVDRNRDKVNGRDIISLLSKKD
jgi:hypothetical protein